MLGFVEPGFVSYKSFESAEKNFREKKKTACKSYVGARKVWTKEN